MKKIRGKYRSLLISSIVIAAIAFIILMTIVVNGDLQRFYLSLLVNYLFFTPAAAGLVVIPAMIVLSHGDWMGDLERFCWTGFSFSIPSLMVLVLLWLGSESWAPWVLKEHHHEIWLNNNFLFIRNLVLQLIFWALAFILLRKKGGKNFRVWAGWLAICFVVTFSLMGFDFVMALEPEWYSMMAGGYFFISGIYISISLWILMSVIMDTPIKDRLHDMGKLLIAFCLITTYLMFSQLMPIWFENIPHETKFLVPRMNLAWKPISFLLLAVVYLGPVLLLLPAGVKKHPKLLGGISAVIFFGMLVERWWLVYAVFYWNEIVLGWPEILMFILFTGVFTMGVLLNLKYPGFKQTWSGQKI